MYRLHKETGKARPLSQVSLFNLLMITVVLSTLTNALVGFLPIADRFTLWWWVGLGITIILLVTIVSMAIVQDDRRIGSSQTMVDWVCGYQLDPKTRKVAIIKRKSYEVTYDASQAWNSCRQNGGGHIQKGDTLDNKIIQSDHFDLLRYLLAQYLSEFGKLTAPPISHHFWLTTAFADSKIDRKKWPKRFQDNKFISARGSSFTSSFDAPANSTLFSADSGDELLTLSWTAPRFYWIKCCPWFKKSFTARTVNAAHPKPKKHSWTIMDAFRKKFTPHGIVRIKWRGPLGNPKDKREDMILQRVPRPFDPKNVLIINTRLIIEVETHGNFTGCAADFQDWALNLALYIQQKMDFHTWWDFAIERTILMIDEKIGYIDRKLGPSINTLLQRMDHRLGRLEEHFWPDEPPEEGEKDAWLGG